MVSQQEKASCVLLFAKSLSVFMVQHEFQRKYNRNTLTSTSTRRWCKQFQETGCLCKGKNPGHPGCSPENVERVLWGYMKSLVFVPPLPATVPELRQCDCDAVQTINTETFLCVWQELQYCSDIIWGTKGSRIY
ncbi:DUF4817 domain-containing protein [Trichonephila clavipes]|nr:DUF4817 domain-containing protein [Trichonephila clavipes]